MWVKTNTNNGINYSKKLYQFNLVISNKNTTFIKRNKLWH